MNPTAVAFISCVNDEAMYKKCVSFIEKLKIPSGFEIEVIPIYGARSMTSGYNTAMKQSDAKYKVYLHQDTFILNNNFIEDILKIFEQDQNIGMIGIAGARQLPPSGTWWEDPAQCGKVLMFTNSFQSILFGEIYADYESVQAIDGVIMVTQYDVEWNENIDGFHFYDTSQCLNFNRQGYQIVIPNQKYPWVLHYCFDDVNFVEYYSARLRFHRHYHMSEWYPTCKTGQPSS